MLALLVEVFCGLLNRKMFFLRYFIQIVVGSMMYTKCSDDGDYTRLAQDVFSTSL